MELYAGLDLHSRNTYIGILDNELKQVFKKRAPGAGSGTQTDVSGSTSDSSQTQPAVFNSALLRSPRQRQ